MTYLRVREVTSYGGFFGGDSITLIATPLDDGDGRTLTIEQDDLAVDRHRIVGGMVLDARLEGDHIARATIAAAPERAQLRDMLPPEAGPLDGPRAFSHYCKACALWIRGEPLNGTCRLLGHTL